MSLLRFTTVSMRNIIKIDWNGKFINSYDFTDDISGQFYVDEHSNKIYLIRQQMSFNDRLFKMADTWH